jgi:transcriptional regulator with XRE-family HTH domain
LISEANMADTTKYNRIKVELAEAGRRNQELAEFLGVHITTVSDWCTNKNQPSIQDLYKISEFLRIDVRRLLVTTNWVDEVTKAAEDQSVFKKPKKQRKKRK